MNIKFLMTTSLVALVSVSTVQAADVIVSHQAAPVKVKAAPVVAVPEFSWTGFYIGAQAGLFSSDTKIINSDVEKNNVFTTVDAPKPSGFRGGVYLGYNVELGQGFVLGIETDAVLASGKDEKEDAERTIDDKEVTALNTAFEKAGNKPSEAFAKGQKIKETYTYDEKWSGATRIHIGFAVSTRIMPYLSAGITYAQIQGVYGITEQKKDDATVYTAPGQLYDETKTMTGYTLGGGLNFAVTDNVIVRAEYRYSDFGKEKFVNSTREFSDKTNDFRVGVAYKF
ncbi:outer membrane protein [Bartonella doshiae]|uniref:outer membrane protein n=1 Tax=Bartonella doshiae TaxID=33044 RepID=UPI001ABAD4BE|nr:outer membrane protein [Bartonella doshiae]